MSNWVFFVSSYILVLRLTYSKCVSFAANSYIELFRNLICLTCDCVSVHVVDEVDEGEYGYGHPLPSGDLGGGGWSHLHGGGSLH